MLIPLRFMIQKRLFTQFTRNYSKELANLNQMPTIKDQSGKTTDLPMEPVFIQFNFDPTIYLNMLQSEGFTKEESNSLLGLISEVINERFRDIHVASSIQLAH